MGVTHMLRTDNNSLVILSSTGLLATSMSNHEYLEFQNVGLIIILKGTKAAIPYLMVELIYSIIEMFQEACKGDWPISYMHPIIIPLIHSIKVMLHSCWFIYNP